MPRDFIPSREPLLVTWLGTFGGLISGTPTLFGVTVGQATSFAAASGAFITAYNTARADGTRTTPAVITKNAAKAAVIASARQLAGVIQKYPGTTNAMRSQLGLTVRVAPSPIPAPNAAPDMDIVSSAGNTVKIRLHDASSGSKRGKPPGVSGASVFSFVGAVPPTDASGWTFEGNTTRTAMNVAFPSATAPGAKVWLCAFWFNAKSQSGPPCAAVGTNIPGGAAMAMAA